MRTIWKLVKNNFVLWLSLWPRPHSNGHDDSIKSDSRYSNSISSVVLLNVAASLSQFHQPICTIKRWQYQVCGATEYCSVSPTLLHNLVFSIRLMHSVQHFDTFFTSTVAIESVKNDLWKSCSALAPKMLVKLTPGKNSQNFWGVIYTLECIDLWIPWLNILKSIFRLIGKYIVKNMFGFTILYCTIFNVIDKSYRQVLTLINNSQLLLKPEILDKFRLVTNQWSKDKGNCNIF